MVKGLPVSPQFCDELSACPPVHFDLMLAKIAIQVVPHSCPFSERSLRVDRHELHGEMHVADALVHVGDETAEKNAEIPIGELIPQEKERSLPEGPRDSSRNDVLVLVLRRVSQEVQVIVLRENQGFRHLGASVQMEYDRALVRRMELRLFAKNRGAGLENAVPPT